MNAHKINKSGITKEQFAAATTEQVIVDIHGRRWDILANLGAPHGLPELMVRCPGHDAEDLTYHDDLGIIDEEQGTIIELNDPRARIETSGTASRSDAW